MNNQEITENNKLIAEFMGYKQDANGKYEIIEDFDIVENIQTYVEDDDYRTVESGIVLVNFLPKEMRFDISWDWLMPVVEKINTIDDYAYSVFIKSADVTIYGNIHNIDVVIVECKHSTDELIKAVYEAVVKFIQIHNKQNDDSVSNEGQ